MDIEDWRRKIDAFNEQFLALLNQRAECALAIGRLKQAAGQPIYAPEREEAVLTHLKNRNGGPLTVDITLSVDPSRTRLWPGASAIAEPANPATTAKPSPRTRKTANGDCVLSRTPAT